MRIIKLAIISFIFFFIVVTGVSLLIPSNITLTKVAIIQANKDSIFHLVENKNEWYRWHPSYKKNPNHGTLQNLHVITISKTDSSLHTQWKQPGKKTLDMDWILYPEQGTFSTLQWSMHFHQAWYLPWQKLGSLFYEQSYGRMMEDGLADLKSELEHRSNTSAD